MAYLTTPYQYQIEISNRASYPPCIECQENRLNNCESKCRYLFCRAIDAYTDRFPINRFMFEKWKFIPNPLLFDSLEVAKVYTDYWYNMCSFWKSSEFFGENNATLKEHMKRIKPWYKYSPVPLICYSFVKCFPYAHVLGQLSRSYPLIFPNVVIFEILYQIAISFIDNDYLKIEVRKYLPFIMLLTTKGTENLQKRNKLLQNIMHTTVYYPSGISRVIYLKDLTHITKMDMTINYFTSRINIHNDYCSNVAFDFDV